MMLPALPPALQILGDSIVPDVILDDVALPAHPRGFAWRHLPRFKTINGKRYQLHATRGWKCIGRAR